ncbi:hypothetical protein BHM03_00013442 [Ensete ventricosum]|nr:hypothetical protein BHM03_00013442 [Ensete ventricosum]
MASPSGTSSGSSHPLNSGSGEDLQAIMHQKKLKRMISNRESARRSRMRKQQHLDELMAQANQLRKENRQLLTNLSLTKQHYAAVEYENSVLRAQVMELRSRLQSLDEILDYLNVSNMSVSDTSTTGAWNCSYINQPIMASADSIFYY